MQLLIVGDSHTGSLERGRALLDGQGALPSGIDWDIRALGTGARMNQPFWKAEGAHAVLLDPVYAGRVPRLPPEDPRPDAVGLSMPLWSGRVMRGLLQEGFVPHGLPGQGRAISQGLLRHLVRRDMQHALALGRFLRDTGLPVFVIEPPRAFRAWRFVRQNGAEAVLALQAAVRAQQRAEIAAAGLPVVDLPEDACDAEGFMRDIHAHEDPTDTHHTNAAFGAVMLQRVATLARGLAAGAAQPAG